MATSGSAKATGDGPVTRCSTPSTRSCPTTAILRLSSSVHAVTEGTDAQAQVIRTSGGRRPHRHPVRPPTPTTLTASAKAYVNALNNLFARKEKSAPDAIASGF
jgi:2-isopropylmalate synthase